VVEDLLDRSVVDAWRVEEAEKRAKAAHQTTATQPSKKKKSVQKAVKVAEDAGSSLRGWDSTDY